MQIYANPYLLCNIGVYNQPVGMGNVYVAAFFQDYHVTDSNLTNFMQTQPNVASVEIQNNTLYARVDTYFESVETTVPLPMEMETNYYLYLSTTDGVIGAFRGNIPLVPPPDVSDSLSELSVNGVSISGNISDSPIAYTYTAVLADHAIGTENVDSFISTHDIPDTGAGNSDSLVQPFHVLLNRPFDIHGNRLPFVQTTLNYHAYIRMLNQNTLQTIHPFEIQATNSIPSENVELSDLSFPKFVNHEIHHQGNLDMGDLDGNIVFATSVASAFSGNTTYFVSVYDADINASSLELLQHLYDEPMRTGHLTGSSDHDEIRIGHCYANTDSSEMSVLQKNRNYRMSLLVLETETNHYSGEIRHEELPTFYPQIDTETYFTASPIPSSIPS